MKVSIVVPCRNRPEELERLLASLATLDPAPAEILVVDDGSRPALPVSAPARVLRFETSVGPAAAKNRGAAATTGDYILFMDSDTEVCDPGLLARLVKVFEDRPDCGVAGGEWLLRDGKWRVALRRFLPDGRLETRLVDEAPVTSEVSHISSSNLMMRRDVFAKLGGYWEPYVYIMEDTDLCFLARASGLKVYTGSELSVRHFRTATARVPAFVRKMNLRNQALFHWCWDRRGWAVAGLAQAMASTRAPYAVPAALSLASLLGAADRRRAELQKLPEAVWA